MERCEETNWLLGVCGWMDGNGEGSRAGDCDDENRGTNSIVPLGSPLQASPPGGRRGGGDTSCSNAF